MGMKGFDSLVSAPPPLIWRVNKFLLMVDSLMEDELVDDDPRTKGVRALPVGLLTHELIMNQGRKKSLHF